MTSLEQDRSILARKRAILSQQNRLHGPALTLVPPEKWPATFNPVRKNYSILQVWQSCDFLVQVISEKDHIRLTINRTQINERGMWIDNITWDEMQEIKNSCGFADKAAVEIFPPATQIVNVANMRHLWILPEPPSFMWLSPSSQSDQ